MAVRAGRPRERLPRSRSGASPRIAVTASKAFDGLSIASIRRRMPMLSILAPHNRREHRFPH